jgi:hypothetical protein
MGNLFGYKSLENIYLRIGFPVILTLLIRLDSWIELSLFNFKLLLGKRFTPWRLLVKSTRPDSLELDIGDCIWMGFWATVVWLLFLKNEVIWTLLICFFS